MARSPIRKDKTCLNCNYVVEKRFCPNCGQENTDTRKTFHHLFIHFFEDLTHYENSFWKTIKNLVLRPASGTKEYLSGKRMSYLAPIRLYIFISFATFFIIAVFPSSSDELVTVQQKSTTKVTDKNGITKDSIIAIQNGLKEIMATDEKVKINKDTINILESENMVGYKNVKQLDSLQEYGPEAEKLDDFEYSIIKKVLLVTEKNSKAEIIKKFLKAFLHNFPKILFIYMPLFAFVLWLFHGKKRWYYFDHGIFTLHYFSFLLLLFLIVFLFNELMYCFVVNAFTTFSTNSVNLILTLWMFYYFFPAHHRFYGETRTISFVKSISMLVINTILIAVLLTVYMIYIFINIQ